MAISEFHPAIRSWFATALGEPTLVQIHAWPVIREGRHALIAAPTGSGKTLAAFLAAIDLLVRQALAQSLMDATSVLYISPLRALSNDIQRNLQGPLAEIRAALERQGRPLPEIRAWVRTGDTHPGERQRMRSRPPHIIVTTPESFYILLTSRSGRQILSTVQTVIVDEIHALAGTKRGAHLALSLERLATLTGRAPQRIGLSATQKPIQELAAYLSGGARDCAIINIGHCRDRDLALDVPGAPLTAVMSNEGWAEIYDRLAELIEAHRTSLIFVNTRRLCERVARHLADRLGETAVTSHHGSLARVHRLEAERRLKEGSLRALVATASLELGIDIGDVDLVCQLGSPRSISVLLQRVGRSGHGIDRIPKGRLFPLTRDDLVECTALLEEVRCGELDRIRIPVAPLDVLAQQMVAEVAASGEWREEDLYHTFSRAWPYRGLERETFTAVLKMLSEGYASRWGRRGAYLHRDAVHARLRPRRGAGLVAITNGGAIPDQFDYDVLLQPEGLRVGSVNEDFAFESMPGDIFQLGNIAYRILKVESGRVFVEDAKGAPPNIPFWFGEAPGRTDELSLAVSRLREAMAVRIAEGGAWQARDWLIDTYGLTTEAATQLAEYLAAAHAALGTLPSQTHLVLERFFDEVGDMHLVLHSPFGSRLNRAWGLALRKRFCRRFNFELQAAALEDSIVLSLGPTHSFPLVEVAGYLRSASVREVLIQALLDAPMFNTRWRWCATIALAVQRSRNGRRRPPQLQRQDAEDLLSVVFPEQLACVENLAGPRAIPNHPLVCQTVQDCLTESMDIAGLERLLRELELGAIKLTCRDLTMPSPLAEEVINARPYAFLDDAPQEERRTRAVASGAMPLPAVGEEWGRPDPEAIARVCLEAWPEPRDPEELHDALVVLGFLTSAEGARGPLSEHYRADWQLPDWRSLFASLAHTGRATLVTIPGGESLWVAAERLAEVRCLHPEATLCPGIDAVAGGEAASTSQTALTELIRSRLDGLGPVTAAQLAAPLGLPVQRIQAVLSRLEGEGFAVQGRFTEAEGPPEWCERRLLARIHRYSIHRLRAEIEPVSVQDYLRFLLDWHGLIDRLEGQEGLAQVLQQLEGFQLPASAWESEILPSRVERYTPQLLDQLLTTGRFIWLRLAPPRVQPANGQRRPGPLRQTPISLIERVSLPMWRAVVCAPDSVQPGLSSGAHRVLSVLQLRGASFFTDLVEATGLLRTQVEEALAELVTWGCINSDTFSGLRALSAPAHKRPAFAPRGRRRKSSVPGVAAAGRWACLVAGHTQRQEMPALRISALQDLESLEHVARVLLQRYGVVFRKVLERESVLPPWRKLLYVYRRLEARGEIRGGRFVQQFSGEQFALPQAVEALKQIRRRDCSGTLVTVSAADPLNLLGILTPGERLPATASNRLVYCDGNVEAVSFNGTVRYLRAHTPQRCSQLQHWLLRRPEPGLDSASGLR